MWQVYVFYVNKKYTNITAIRPLIDSNFNLLELLPVKLLKCSRGPEGMMELKKSRYAELSGD